MKVAMFRPENRASFESFKKEGIEVVHAPLIEIVEDVEEINRFAKAEFDVAIVTSVTAVEILRKHELLDKLRGKELIAIGEKTAEKLEELGFKSKLPEKFDSKSVVKEFKGKLRGKIALIRSDRGDPVLLEVGDCEEFRIYRILKKHGKKQLEVVKMVCEGEVDFAVFSSRMIVKSFFELCEKEKLGKPKCRVIAIGPPTKDELEKRGVKSLMPEKYTFEGILELLKKYG